VTPCIHAFSFLVKSIGSISQGGGNGNRSLDNSGGGVSYGGGMYSQGSGMNSHGSSNGLNDGRGDVDLMDVGVRGGYGCDCLHGYGGGNCHGGCNCHRCGSIGGHSGGTQVAGRGGGEEQRQKNLKEIGKRLREFRIPLGVWFRGHSYTKIKSVARKSDPSTSSSFLA